MHSLTLALVAMGFSLAAVQAAGQAQPAPVESTGHDAKLYVYRINSPGLGNGINLIFDGVKVAKLGNNECTAIRVAPGDHQIEMSAKSPLAFILGDSDGPPKLGGKLSALPDSTIYYQYNQILKTIGYNLSQTEYRLDRVEKDVAEPELAKCKTIKPSPPSVAPG